MILMMLLLLMMMMIMMLMQYYLSYPKKFNGIWKAWVKPYIRDVPHGSNNTLSNITISALLIPPEKWSCCRFKMILTPTVFHIPQKIPKLLVILIYCKSPLGSGFMIPGLTIRSIQMYLAQIIFWQFGNALTSKVRSSICLPLAWFVSLVEYKQRAYKTRYHYSSLRSPLAPPGIHASFRTGQCHTNACIWKHRDATSSQCANLHGHKGLPATRDTMSGFGWLGRMTAGIYWGSRQRR